jgi:hypothetical protein
MRPFRFFFLLAVGFILFFAVARIVIFAMIFAAIMSIIFFGIRTLASFFRNLAWDRENAYDYRKYGYDNDRLDLYSRSNIFEKDETQAPWERERIIQIR